MSIRKASGTVLESDARTATPADIPLNSSALGGSGNAVVNMHIIIDVTAIALTPIVQPKLFAKDPVSGKEYDLLAGIATITGVGTTVLKLGRDIVAAAGLAAKDFIPEGAVLRFTHTDADSITYSVGVNAEFEPYV